MSTATKNQGPVSGVVHSMTDLAGDVLEIVELQVRLTQKDAQEAIARSFIPLIAMVVGMSMLVASLPVLAFALAKLIQNQLDVPEWAALLGVSFTMIVLAIVTSYVAFRTIRRSLSTFGRSTAELTKNIAWLTSIARRDQN